MDISKELKEHNCYALENITEYALRQRYVKEFWVFIENLDIKRPHYFWPIFLLNGKEKGEIGNQF